MGSLVRLVSWVKGSLEVTSWSVYTTKSKMLKLELIPELGGKLIMYIFDQTYFKILNGPPL